MIIKGQYVVVPAALLLLCGTAWIAAQQGGVNLLARSRLLMSQEQRNRDFPAGEEERNGHTAVIVERDVDPTKTFYSKDQMPLMQSPCRPESDGYFGATSGDPILLQYGVEIETAPRADIGQILDDIRETLTDEILAMSFPFLCGFRRKLSRASGFRFGYELETEESCFPLVSDLNHCGIYRGTIAVYGQDSIPAGELILALVTEILNSEETKEDHMHLVRIKSADRLMKLLEAGRGSSNPDQPRTPSDSSDYATREDDGLSLVIIASIVVFGVVFLFFVVWFLVARYGHYRHDVPYQKECSPYTKSTGGVRKFSSITTRGRQRRRKAKGGKSYEGYLDDTDQVSDQDTVETIDFQAGGGGSALVMDGGRPSFIEFDPNFLGSVSLNGTEMT